MELILLLLAGAFYFLPSIVGWNRDNITQIFLLNLLLGWSLIGWVVALIWAAGKDRPQVTYNNNPPPRRGSITDELEKLSRLRRDGDIGEAEYQQLKAKCLGQY